MIFTNIKRNIDNQKLISEVINHKPIRSNSGVRGTNSKDTNVSITKAYTQDAGRNAKINVL